MVLDGSGNFWKALEGSGRLWMALGGSGHAWFDFYRPQQVSTHLDRPWQV